MRIFVLATMLIGIVALLATSWFWPIDAFHPRGPVLPVIPSSIRDTMQVTISAILMAASLLVILSRKYGPKEQNWAYGTIGMLIGFWMKAS
jgi:hypothetical protein